VGRQVASLLVKPFSPGHGEKNRIPPKAVLRLKEESQQISEKKKIKRKPGEKSFGGHHESKLRVKRYGGGELGRETWNERTGMTGSGG